MCAWLLSGALGCADSSSDEEDDDDEETSAYRYKCFEGTLDCLCFELGPGDDAASSEPEVLVCGAFNCCLQDNGLPPGDRLCECADLATDCQAEANSRPGTIVVPTCPPGDIDLSRCAASGVSCREDFLQQRNLVGCCPGLSCQMDAAGIPVCL